MDILSIIIIGIGLSMDCFAVSISKGLGLKTDKLTTALKMGFLFGLFQGAMPIISFFAGKGFATQIANFDHWIAFGLLVTIGSKMIFEAFESNEKTDCELTPALSLTTLVTLAFATSIDALASGIIFISYPSFIYLAAIIIGLTSFIFTLIGVFIGGKLGKNSSFKIELFGGFILIGVGSKILIEHLFV